MCLIVRAGLTCFLPACLTYISFEMPCLIAHKTSFNYRCPHNLYITSNLTFCNYSYNKWYSQHLPAISSSEHLFQVVLKKSLIYSTFCFWIACWKSWAANFSPTCYITLWFYQMIIYSLIKFHS